MFMNIMAFIYSLLYHFEHKKVTSSKFIKYLFIAHLY